MQNLKILNYYRFVRKITSYIVQMFHRTNRTNIYIKKLDTYVNTHLICIKYAKLYNIKKYALFTHSACFTWLKLSVGQLKTY